MSAPDHGCVVSVNVGEPQPLRWRGKTILTGIYKSPVDGRVALAGDRVDGDRQADRRHHGGRDKAVYAYAGEDLVWWTAQLDRPMPPALLGENLTLLGLDVSAALVGERWAVGSAVLEVTMPRTPCFKLGIRMGDQRFVRRFAAAARPGAYLRIINEGEIGTGDTATVLHRPDHLISVAAIAAATRKHAGGGLGLLAAAQRALEN